jgi:myo-inositol 2-dehydrogenase/D-chiro-inositol 1-dehydrogenase
MNRRHFLKNSAVAASAISTVGIPTIVPATVFGKNAPSNRIPIGLIGTGRQGYGQNLQGSDLQSIDARIPGLLDLPDVQVVAVCDVDSWRMEKAKTTVESHYAKKAPGGTF